MDASTFNQLTQEDAAIMRRFFRAGITNPAGIIHRDNIRESQVFVWLTDRRDFRPDVRVTWQDMEICKARIRSRIARGAA